MGTGAAGSDLFRVNPDQTVGLGGERKRVQETAEESTDKQENSTSTTNKKTHQHQYERKRSPAPRPRAHAVKPEKPRGISPTGER
jgi:hypothetical protein